MYALRVLFVRLASCGDVRVAREVMMTDWAAEALQSPDALSGSRDRGGMGMLLESEFGLRARKECCCNDQYSRFDTVNESADKAGKNVEVVGEEASVERERCRSVKRARSSWYRG